jgi:hypothetical protein
MAKNSIKGLCFGDHSNNNLETFTCTDILITGVSDTENNNKENNNNNEEDDHQEHPYEIQIDKDNDEAPPLEDPTLIYDHVEEQQGHDHDSSNENNEDNDRTGVDLENN